MGNTVSGTVKEFDKRNPKENAAKEALEVLNEVAQDHLERFYEQIKNNPHDTKLVPIKRVLSCHHYIQCISQDEKTVNNSIADVVSEFSTGNIAKGLGSLATSTIHRLLEASSGVQNTETKYAISIDPLGGIFYLDTFFFVFNFKSENLARVGSFVAVCIVKSSADTSGIDDNTLRVLINESFGSSGMDVRKAIFAEIKEVLSRGEGYGGLVGEGRKSQREELLAWSAGASGKAHGVDGFRKGG